MMNAYKVLLIITNNKQKMKLSLKMRLLFEDEDSTLMAIPTELVPAVLELIDKHIAVKQHQSD